MDHLTELKNCVLRMRGCAPKLRSYVPRPMYCELRTRNYVPRETNRQHAMNRQSVLYELSVFILVSLFGILTAIQWDLVVSVSMNEIMSAVLISLFMMTKDYFPNYPQHMHLFMGRLLSRLPFPVVFSARASLKLSLKFGSSCRIRDKVPEKN